MMEKALQKNKKTYEKPEAIDMDSKQINNTNKIITQLIEETATPSRELTKYKEEYRKEFLEYKNPIATNIEHIVRSVENSQILILGDDHADIFYQEMVFDVIKRLGENVGTIFLECVYFEKQTNIDKYRSGKINFDEFLKKVSWKKNWGFDHSVIEKIFAYSKENGIKLIAMNGPKINEGDLNQRDNFMGDLVIQSIEKEKNPIKTSILIVGSLHLAKNHLPYFLRQHTKEESANMRITRISPLDSTMLDMSRKKNIEPKFIKWDDDTFSMTPDPTLITKELSFLHYVEDYDSKGGGRTRLTDLTEESAQD